MVTFDPPASSARRMSQPSTTAQAARAPGRGPIASAQLSARTSATFRSDPRKKHAKIAPASVSSVRSSAEGGSLTRWLKPSDSAESPIRRAMSSLPC